MVLDGRAATLLSRCRREAAVVEEASAGSVHELLADRGTELTQLMVDDQRTTVETGVGHYWYERYHRHETVGRRRHIYNTTQS